MMLEMFHVGHCAHTTLRTLKLHAHGMWQLSLGFAADDTWSIHT